MRLFRKLWLNFCCVAFLASLSGVFCVHAEPGPGSDDAAPPVSSTGSASTASTPSSSTGSASTASTAASSTGSASTASTPSSSTGSASTASTPSSSTGSASTFEVAKTADVAPKEGPDGNFQQTPMPVAAGAEELASRPDGDFVYVHRGDPDYDYWVEVIFSGFLLEKCWPQIFNSSNRQVEDITLGLQDSSGKVRYSGAVKTLCRYEDKDFRSGKAFYHVYMRSNIFAYKDIMGEEYADQLSPENVFGKQCRLGLFHNGKLIRIFNVVPSSEIFNKGERFTDSGNSRLKKVVYHSIEEDKVKQEFTKRDGLSSMPVGAVAAVPYADCGSGLCAGCFSPPAVSRGLMELLRHSSQSVYQVLTKFDRVLADKMDRRSFANFNTFLSEVAFSAYKPEWLCRENWTSWEVTEIESRCDVMEMARWWLKRRFLLPDGKSLDLKSINERFSTKENCEKEKRLFTLVSYIKGILDMPSPWRNQGAFFNELKFLEGFYSFAEAEFRLGASLSRKLKRRINEVLEKNGLGFICEREPNALVMFSNWISIYWNEDTTLSELVGSLGDENSLFEKVLSDFDKFIKQNVANSVEKLPVKQEKKPVVVQQAGSQVANLKNAAGGVEKAADDVDPYEEAVNLVSSKVKDRLSRKNKNRSKYMSKILVASVLKKKDGGKAVKFKRYVLTNKRLQFLRKNITEDTRNSKFVVALLKGLLKSNKADLSDKLKNSEDDQHVLVVVNKKGKIEAIDSINSMLEEANFNEGSEEVVD